MGNSANKKSTTGKATAKSVAKPKASVEAKVFDCIVAQQGSQELVCFKINAKELDQIVDINKRDPDKKDGYQRVLSVSRTTAIAEFFNRGKAIPNNILVSFESSVKLSADKKSIEIPLKKVGWVIDGQHRLSGAVDASVDVELIVVAFLGLPLEEQIQQFLTINNEGKGVPTSLLYDLLAYLPPNKSQKDVANERATDIAHKIRTDKSSPFQGRIAIMNAPKKGEISLTNFVRKVSSLVLKDKGKFNKYSFDEQAKIINNYFKALVKVYPTQSEPSNSVFFMTIGFGAMINSIDTVFDYTYKNEGGFAVDDVSKTLKVVEDFDFEDFKNVGTGSAAEVQAGKDFSVALELRMKDKTGEEGKLRL